MKKFYYQAYALVWTLTRPRGIKQMMKANPPTICYTLTTTGQHALIYSYSEDGTVTIDTTMLGVIPINVFGINPSDLEVCGCTVKGAVQS